MWLKALIVFSTLFAGFEAGAVVGACGTRQLPRDKVRRVRNIRLLCSSRTSHYVRTPAAWPPERFEKWRDLELVGTLSARKKMQAIGQELPLIEWKGQIPYVTTEAWDWTEWYFGKAPPPTCPEVVQKHTRTVVKDGKQVVEEYETREWGECWHDEDRSEARFCSNETMTYEAKFERPDISAWHPEMKEYYDILPNKYDLLPGEVEDVQISNSGGNSTELNPYTEVGDAWNKYRYQNDIVGYGSSAKCRFNHSYHLKVNIVTDAREERRGPNAFRTPVDQFGRDTDSLEWNIAPGTDGKEVRTIPRLIKLMDASDTIISALSRHSRDFGDPAEAERIENGGGQSQSKEKQKKVIENNPFWKDTQVRVVLYKIRDYNRDIRVTERMYNRGADVNFNGNYEIPLFSADEDKRMFRSAGPLIPDFWKKIYTGLEPGANYQFLVAMYNKGVPFYAQDCNDAKNKGHWNCRLGFRGEDNWYSKPLELGFHAEKTIMDERPAVQKFADFQRKSLWGKIKSIWE